MIINHSKNTIGRQREYLDIRNKRFLEELKPTFLGYDTDRLDNDASNNSSIVACVFIAAVIFQPSSCLAMIGEYIYRHTHCWEGYVK
jgi:hypothetical protein